MASSLGARTVVVVQPSYVPWRGYFDLIRRSDTFVFYDDVQYDKHGWRNRNQIKTPAGLQWLTIPTHSRGNVERHVPINSIEIDNRSDWRRKHLESIRHAYRRAPHFESTFAFLSEAFACEHTLLADFTIELTTRIAQQLGLNPRFLRSSDMLLSGAKTERLIATLVHAGATHYVSGPSAKAYIEPERFRAAGITLEYIDYSYVPYPQLHGDFAPFVSIIDLMMMAGSEAGELIAPVERHHADSI